MPDLPSLIDVVAANGGQDPLERITAAEEVAAELGAMGDRLIGHFVEQARALGCSWTQIGGHLGVSRQAAQQRYTPRSSQLTFEDLVRAGSLSRFTPRTIEAVRRAEDHARRLRQDSLAPDHVVLGVLDAENYGRAAVGALAGDVDRVRKAIEKRTPVGDGDEPRDVAVGPEARRAFAAGLAEALELGHNYIGTEHLLLGVLREGEGVAAEVLVDRGVTLEATRAKVIELLTSR